MKLSARARPDSIPKFEGKTMNNDYVTKDFGLSCYLLATENRLKSYLKANGVTRFIFEGSKKLDDLVTKFYTQEATVNVAAFSSAQRTLKSIIYDDGTMENNENVKQPIIAK
jgi:hypothetical protein